MKKARRCVIISQVFRGPERHSADRRNPLYDDPIVAAALTGLIDTGHC
jgi:hypothetical protein